MKFSQADCTCTLLIMAPSETDYKTQLLVHLITEPETHMCFFERILWHDSSTRQSYSESAEAKNHEPHVWGQFVEHGEETMTYFCKAWLYVELYSPTRLSNIRLIINSVFCYLITASSIRQVNISDQMKLRSLSWCLCRWDKCGRAFSRFDFPRYFMSSINVSLLRFCWQAVQRIRFASWPDITQATPPWFCTTLSYSCGPEGWCSH